MDDKHIKRNFAKPKSGSMRRIRNLNKIPDHILNNQDLKNAIALLPFNYNFEIYKSLWKIEIEASKYVGLQFPEGLLIYSSLINDIISTFGKVKTVILADVTYGACCIDDFTSSKIGVDLLIHYGHSCLVPINSTKIKVLYVFVEINFDYSHLVNTIIKNFNKSQHIYLMGTVQFNNILFSAKDKLAENEFVVNIPQSKPLSAGETLGCTSPILDKKSVAIFIADGRFHLEAAMIQNPHVTFYRYDPYSKNLLSEKYDNQLMMAQRRECIEKAKISKKIGVILGTLGRQGNVSIFSKIRNILRNQNKKAYLFLMSEINPSKLSIIKDIDCWVQVACPRLSIDWGSGFDKPILTPYEFYVAFKHESWREVYPMDYYSKDGGDWANYS